MKALVIVLILLFGISSNVEAKVKIPIPWGTIEELHKIQSVEIPGLEDAYFGYGTQKTHFLYVFGLYIETKGYAIGVGQESDNQGEYIDQSAVDNLRTLKVIPEGLSSEPSLSAFDILSGFSFWWILGVGTGLIFLWGFFGRLVTGEFGLARTYWIYGVLVGLVVGLAMRLIPSIGLLAIILLMYTAYQTLVLLGAWRAANKYIGSFVWVVLAKVAVALGGVSLVVILAQIVQLLLR
ncbi:MAG: hypothetical protein WBK08_17295 [Nitrospira sp.]